MDIYKDLTDFPAAYYLQVNSCGTEGNSGPVYTLLRPKGRSDYYLFYVSKGYLEMEIAGEMCRISEGQCVICKPNVGQKITYPSNWQLFCYYVHFTGDSVEKILDAMKLQEISVVSIEDVTLFEVLFRRLLEGFRTEWLQSGGGSVCALPVNGLLLQLLDNVKRSGQKKQKEEHDVILPAMFYMSEHFCEEIDLEHCAAQVHLSVSRFAHLFTQRMGISPHRFILSLRIDKAKELLMYSTMTVNEIAKYVGFPDASYFSRLFRKYTGHAPMEYRRKNP